MKRSSRTSGHFYHEQQFLATTKKKAPTKKRAAKKRTAKARADATTTPKVTRPTETEQAAEFPKLPINWTPRPYQQLVWDKFDEGVRRFLLGWHRRAGKDSCGLNLIGDRSQVEIGSYWHLYPLMTQAKRSIWRGMAVDGVKFIDQAFPRQLRNETNNQDMFISMKWGSTYQLCGSDYYDRLVGANVRGCVFSEWALCDPRAWEYIRPILRENKGWAAFITTFRGRNHAYQMARNMADNPDWYVDIRDITQTTHADGRPIITELDVQKDRDEGMSEARIQEEYYCSPRASSPGAYYGRAMTALTLMPA